MTHEIKMLDDGIEEIETAAGQFVHVDGDGGWVWLDTEVQLHDGICVGVGSDRETALADAKASLQAALAAVEFAIAKGADHA